MSTPFLKRYYPHPFLIGFILIITFFAYSNIFSHPFFGDDYDFILHWPALQTWTSIPQLLQGHLPSAHLGTFRPLRSLIYLLIYQLVGPSPIAYHIFSLATHLAITFLVYLFTFKLTRHPTITTLTTLFFGLHPIHTEAITFITASFDTISYVFFFSSFLLFIHAHTQPKQSLTLVISIILAFLAIGTNETNLILPLIFHLYLKLFSPKPNHHQPSLPFFYLLPIFYLLLRFSIPTATFPRTSHLGNNYLSILLLALTSTIQYLRFLLFPWPLCLVHTLPGGISNYVLPQTNIPLIQSQSIISQHSLTNLSLLLAFLSLAYFLRHRRPLLTFSLLWILLGLLPVTNLLPSALIFSERYVYLSSFGFCLLLAQFVNSLKSKLPRIALVLTLVITISYFHLTISQNQIWKTPSSVWIHALRLYPNNLLANWQLGNSYRLQNNYLQAQHQYLHTLSLDPSFTPASVDLAATYLSLQNYSQAIRTLEQAIIYAPTNSNLTLQLAQIHYQYALTLIDHQQFPSASQHLISTLSLDPQHLLARQTLSSLCSTHKSFPCPLQLTPSPD